MKKHLLHRFTIELNFDNLQLILFDSTGFITNPNGEDIRLEVNSLVSSLPIRVSFPEGQVIEGEFVIDTGAPISLVINSPAAEKQGLHLVAAKNQSREFKTQSDVQTAAEIVSDSIQIGVFDFEDIPVYVSTSNSGLFAVSRYVGIIGTGLLRNFNVIFDYKRKRINLGRIA